MIGPNCDQPILLFEHTFSWYKRVIMDKQLGISRRSLLARLSSIVAVPALSGCRLLVVRVPPPTPPACTPATTPTLPTEFVIDAHCHVFNGSDLPVAPFLERVFNENKSFPGPVMDVIANLLQQSVWNDAPNATQEIQAITEMMKCNPDPAVRMAVLREQVSGKTEEGYSRAQRSIRGAGKIKSLKADARPLSSSGVITEESALAEIRDRVQPTTYAEYKDLRNEKRARTRAKKDSKDSAAEAQGNAESVFDSVVDYIVQNYQYRTVAVSQYQTTFHDVQSADLMVAALVDYDWWLAGGKAPKTNLHKQVDLMSQISILTGGQVHALAPFCPLREVAHRARKSKWSSLQFVQDSVRSKGCIGVKLYPPMGFAAYGNSTLAADTWSNAELPDWTQKNIDYHDGKPTLPLGKRLDDALGALYTWCIAEDVPVMAHTSMTNGTSEKMMNMARAEFWQNALANFSGLRISFGHMGDFSDPAAKTYPQQAQLFASLMETSSGSNAFGDAAYFDEILTGQTSMGTLEGQFKMFYAGSATFRNRMMYGTDWNLLVREGDIGPYLEDFEKMFDDMQSMPGGYPGLKAQFLAGNAATWLGLKGGRTLDRLRTFYATGTPATGPLDISVYRPLWMKKLGV